MMWFCTQIWSLVFTELRAAASYWGTGAPGAILKRDARPQGNFFFSFASLLPFQHIIRAKYSPKERVSAVMICFWWDSNTRTIYKGFEELTDVLENLSRETNTWHKKWTKGQLQNVFTFSFMALFWHFIGENWLGKNMFIVSIRASHILG